MKKKVKEKSKLELRSERVRNIIGDVPPELTRTGTAVILLIVVVVIVVFCDIKIDGKNLWFWMFKWVNP